VKFRYAQVSIGTQTNDWQELTSPKSPLLLGNGTAYSAVHISFRELMSDREDTHGLDVADWGLIRLIKLSESAKPLDDLTWQIRIRPEVKPAPSGAIIFEARLKRPLPTKDWPGGMR
jgi:hypothetical protein